MRGDTDFVRTAFLNLIAEFKEGMPPPKRLYLTIPKGQLGIQFKEYWLNNGFHMHSSAPNVMESN